MNQALKENCPSPPLPPKRKPKRRCTRSYQLFFPCVGIVRYQAYNNTARAPLVLEKTSWSQTDFKTLCGIKPNDGLQAQWMQRNLVTPYKNECAEQQPRNEKGAMQSKSKPSNNQANSPVHITVTVISYYLWMTTSWGMRCSCLWTFPTAIPRPKWKLVLELLEASAPSVAAFGHLCSSEGWGFFFKIHCLIFWWVYQKCIGWVVEGVVRHVIYKTSMLCNQNTWVRQVLQSSTSVETQHLTATTCAAGKGTTTVGRPWPIQCCQHLPTTANDPEAQPFKG